MKTNHMIALIFVLAGTNLFTFATTRYLTTKEVLTTAKHRMDSALKREGLYELVFRPDRPQSVPLSLAISQAGGNYYWWNDGLPYWGAAALLTITGVFVPFVQSRRQHVS